jgi:hypothetical protein
MKKYFSHLLPIFLAFIFADANSQVNKKSLVAQNNSGDILYKQEAIAFIKQIEGGRLNDNFILVDKPAPLNSNDCLEQVLTDTITFSKIELKVISKYKNSLGKDLSDYWANAYLNVNVIKKDTVDAIFKNYHRHWGYFHKNIGRSFNEFSVPLFIRNNTYCLFYSANYCGGLCGGGNLILYKKSNGVWVSVKSYCDWES